MKSGSGAKGLLRTARLALIVAAAMLVSAAPASATTQAFSYAGTAGISLTLTTTGLGSGYVDSSPPGIDCGQGIEVGRQDCSEVYDNGTLVTLTAHPADNSEYQGFSGGGCSGSSTSCQVTMDQARSVTASFSLKPGLIVTTAGTGSGVVDSSPSGIDCGLATPGHSDCQEIYSNGTLVTLTGHPGANTDFLGFSGEGCSGTSTSCQVTMDQARRVTATFRLHQYSLDVASTGGGYVRSAPAGIDCGMPATHASCSAAFDLGTQVILTAHPAPISDFAGFSGDGCSGVSLTCTVTVDEAKSVAATFVPGQRELRVNLLGSGSGSLTSSPAGIDCGLHSPAHKDCVGNFTAGAQVTLHAHERRGTHFRGFGSSPCLSSGSTCRLKIVDSRSMRATYVRESASLHRCCHPQRLGKTKFVLRVSTHPDPLRVRLRIRNRGRVVEARTLTAKGRGGTTVAYRWSCDEAGRHIATAAAVAAPGFHPSSSTVVFKTPNCRHRWKGALRSPKIAGHSINLRFADAWKQRQSYRACVRPPQGPQFCGRSTTRRRGKDVLKLHRKLVAGHYQVKWFVGRRLADSVRFKAHNPKPPQPPQTRPCHRGPCAIALRVATAMARDIYLNEASARDYGASCRTDGSPTFRCDAIVSGIVPTLVGHGTHYTCRYGATVTVANGHARGQFTGSVIGDNPYYCPSN